VTSVAAVVVPLLEHWLAVKEEKSTTTIPLLSWELEI
jgi:hypothetical protein